MWQQTGEEVEEEEIDEEVDNMVVGKVARVREEIVGGREDIIALRTTTTSGDLLAAVEGLPWVGGEHLVGDQDEMLEPELTRNHWSTPEEPLVAEEFAPLDNLEGMPGALREAALGTRAPLEAHLEVDLGMQHPYMMNSCYSSGVINILYWIQIYKNQSNSSLQDGARTFKNEKFSNLLKDLGVGARGVWKILSM